MSSFAFQMDAFAYYFHCYVFKIDEKELLLLLLFLFKKAQKKRGWDTDRQLPFILWKIVLYPPNFVTHIFLQPSHSQTELHCNHCAVTHLLQHGKKWIKTRF